MNLEHVVNCSKPYYAPTANLGGHSILRAPNNAHSLAGRERGGGWVGLREHDDELEEKEGEGEEGGGGKKTV